MSLKDELHIREEALKAIEEKKYEALSQIESAQADTLNKLQSQFSLQMTSDATDRATVEENREKIAHMSSKLNRIESLEERFKEFDKLHQELETKIELNKEDIQRQLEALTTRVNMQEQEYVELLSHVNTLQQVICKYVMKLK